MQCGSHDPMVAVLAEKYSEARHGRALSNQRVPRLVELYVSPQGSWTLLLTTPRGYTCIYAAGTDWEFVYDVPGPADPNVY